MHLQEKFAEECEKKCLDKLDKYWTFARCVTSSFINELNHYYSFSVDKPSILPGRAREVCCRRAAVVFELENGLVSSSSTELAKKPS